MSFFIRKSEHSGKHRKQRLPFSFLAEIRPFALPLREYEVKKLNEEIRRYDGPHRSSRDPALVF
jgi:hypothetical protein